MIISSQISADLQTPGYPPLVHAVQGEQYSRQLKMALYDGGMAWTVPGGVFVAMRYSKPDGTTGYYDTLPDGTQAWSAEGNTVSIYVAPQMLTVPGVVQGQLEIIQNQSILASFPLRLKVAANVAATLQESADYVNWLEWMEDQLAQRISDAVASGEFRGDPGYTPVKGVDYYTPAEVAQIKAEVTPKKGVDYVDGAPGADAALILDEVSYQAGESGKTPPTGTWQSTIPSVPRGQYLWTRRVKQWNTGDPVTDYSVAYQGIDGSGAVSSVAGVSPDATGNVSLQAADVGALPSSGGDMEGPINMNGQPISGLNAPTEATQAANKGYVDTVIVHKTLTASGWSDAAPYTQTVTLDGLTDGRRARVYPAYGGVNIDTYLAMREACAAVSYAKQDGGNITFVCLEDKPGADIPVMVEVYV